ncbi:UNVERIFIED_CONTAM: movement protein [Sesamum calycinum]|uniref:Movement protein n=1 Tax=Sesamum calycinum TaxID=2727403 RepID=A0AAW2NXU1_9LAMI
MMDSELEELVSSQPDRTKPKKHHIIYKVSSGEFAIPMEFTGNVMEMQLIPKEEILEELSRLREEIAVTMKWIHIGTIEVVIKATFKEGIDSEIHLSIMDRRINNLRDGCLGTMIGNLYAGKLMFDIHPRIAYNLADQDFSRVLTLHQDFKRKDLMKEGNRPYSITYRIAYALSNTHHSDLFLRKEYIEIPRIFKEFAKQPVIGRYEGTLEIAGHEILVTGIAGRENGCMTLGLSFLEDHKPWGRKEYFAAYIDSGSGICTAKPGVFPKEARETLPVIAGRDFSQKILILNTGIREAKIMIGGAFGTPWFRDKRKFGKVLLSFRQQGLIDSDSFYEESKEEIKNLKEAMQELNPGHKRGNENPLAWWDRNKIEATLKLKEECKYEYVRYKPIQMNMEDKKDMQMIIKEHINLGLIEPGISAYSSPGFLIKMESESKKFTAFSTPQGQYIWNVLPMGIFIKDLAKYRKDFRPLLKKQKVQSGNGRNPHTRVRELKQVCNNLPKLAIPQTNELVVYTDANDYRWAAVLMKKTTTGEEPCRYTGGLFTEQQAQVWHINEKEFFAFGRLLRNGLCSYLLKNLH